MAWRDYHDVRDRAAGAAQAKETAGFAGKRREQRALKEAKETAFTEGISVHTGVHLIVKMGCAFFFEEFIWFGVNAELCQQPLAEIKELRCAIQAKSVIFGRVRELQYAIFPFNGDFERFRGNKTL
ncbi:hypothetical protein GCM10008018_03990 [Paenibacillus marchantiophytorum]|uniref:Uncharacterized protein n=1 Tax=Paenibacillus marchantiophytorum TaxID=1619310 RepID=A0ABQ2BNF6_9BACL|nr:hypothetical protein GCM10008018_03990 [Paenibacillus marchantiophytorum]